MKKVLSINFGGRLINIEEDAYAALQQYMESLKNYFSNEEGKDEIITDIEYRIAEIFYDKQKQGTTAIHTDHINEVMNTMGRPTDFANNDNATTSTEHYNRDEQTKQFVRRGKLYRNANEKVVGGVCSGIASYFNVDIVLIRIIFIILLFGGGSGLFIYLLLWIFVPESTTVKHNIERRLFRNNDDKVFGGVASGLANYFGIDVWIPRLIFAAPFIFAFLRSISHIVSIWAFDNSRLWSISFGSGTTVVYFLLWWIIPEALTIQEKMAMKGEKMDLNSIKNNIQDDLKNFSNKATEFGNRVSERATEIANDISSSASKIRQESVRTSKTAGNKIAEGIGLAFKGFILFIAGTIAFSVLVSAIAFMVSGFSIWPFRDFLFDNSWQTFFFLGALLLAIIPGIALIVWVLRRIMKTKAYSKQIRWAVGILTTLGFASTIFLVASISRGFKSYNRNPTSKIDVPLVTPGNKLLVKVSEPEVQYTGEIPWVNIEENGFDITRDSMKYGNVKILIEKSSDSSYHAIIEKYSNGNTEKEADSRAQKIAYNYSAKDSVLDLGSHLSISKNEKFRGQRIIVRLQLPSNGTIIFDESINGKWHPFNIRINSRKRNNDYYSQRIISYSNNFKHLDYAFGERMIMRPNGDLEYVIDKNKEAEKQLKEQEKLEEKRRNDEKVREAKIEEKNKRIRNEAEYKRKEAQKLLDEAEELDEKVNIEQLPLASVFTNTLLPLNVPLYL